MWGGHGSGAAKLGLSIRNVDALDNGVPTRIDLDQRGAVIGRSATVDWSLPDPRAYISSRHAEIDFADGQYRLIDVSTNGTFVNGATERSYEPITLKDGDVITIGHYEIAVTLSGGGAAAAPPPAAPSAASGGWGGWDSGAAPAAPPASGGSGWGAAPSVAAPALGAGAASAAWAAPAIPTPDASAWGAPAADAGGWGAPAPATPAAPSADGWGAPAAPASDGWGAPAAPATPAAPTADGWGSPAPSSNDGWGAAPAPDKGNYGWGAPAAPAAGDNAGWGAAPAADTGSADGWGAPAAPAAPDNAGWGAPPPATGPAPSNASWAAPAPAGPAAPASSFAAPTEAFVPTHKTVEQAPNPSAWDRPAEQGQTASGWSSAVADRPSAPTADDVWGKISDGNVVDWARGGFGAAAAQPEVDKLGLTPRNAIAALPPAAPPPAGGFGGSPALGARPAPAPAAPTAFPTPPAAAAYTPPAAVPMPPQAPPAPQPPAAQPPAPQPPASQAPAPQQAATPGGGEAMARFLAEAGLKRSDLKGNDADLMASAGGLVRRLVSGLVVMLEARARAKSQMGAQSTALEFDGNNPMKFARTPEGALAQLLNPVERGFMPADRAVEDAFHDLQSHQIATLKAMQGALKATLDRFSPTAIKARAEDKGLMSRILPGARDAALWQAYEREFGGVAHGSDEAFMEVFSREFKRAYEEQSARRPKK